MNDLDKRIQELSDSQVVEVLNKVHAELFSAVNYHDVIKAADNSEDSDIQYLVHLDAKTRGAEEDIAEAGDTVRALLIFMAGEETYADVIDKALSEVESSEHLSVVAAIFALGLMVNLTILVSTTKLKYKDGKITVTKGKAPLNLVKAILSPVKDLAKRASIGEEVG